MKKFLSLVTTLCLMFTLCSFISVNTISAEETTNTEKLRVMPLGDSITDGFSTVGGYRVPLCNLLEQNGLSDKIDFVGPNWGGNCYDPQHAGYSGYSIDNIDAANSISGQRTGLSSFIDWLMETYPADVVMLQIGTNDILSFYDLDNMGTRLENLVDKVLSHLPDDGMLYLATIPYMDATNNLYISKDYFTSESMDTYVDNYNKQIKEIVTKKQTEGKNIKLSDVNNVLTKADLYDGVHPSVAGYELMGNHWYNILSNYISNSPDVDDKGKIGDINLDNNITSADLVLLKRVILSLENLSAEQSKYADINQDSIINIFDVISLLRLTINK